MLTWVEYKQIGSDSSGEPLFWKKGYCLSTDTKPTDETDTVNGSEIIEIDTGHTTYWDASTEAWLDPSAS